MSTEVLTQAVDPASDRAVYKQIADHLRAAIAQGRLGAGDQLPSEAQLMTHYGVARMTARNAIVRHQLRLGRELVALVQPALGYRRSQVVGYLLVDGTITRRVDGLGEHICAHSRDSSTRAHV